MNRTRDYQALEREFVCGRMSLRQMCRDHGIAAHSAVMVQARAGNWSEKRTTYQARASSTYIQQHADRVADRQAEIRDHALDAIDEAITRFRSDLRATEWKRIGDEWVEVSAMRVTPRDLAILIDRLEVLFGRPAMISETRGFTTTAISEVPVDVLKRIIELTRGLVDTPRSEASPLPRWPSRPEN